MPDQHYGGVRISGGSVSAAGDGVGRDKISVPPAGVDSATLEKLITEFAHIKILIEQRAEDQDVDKSELQGLVENIEQEVIKGNTANPKKVDRWLKLLDELAEDVFQATAASLSSPVADIAKTVQAAARRVAKQR